MNAPQTHGSSEMRHLDGHAAPLRWRSTSPVARIAIVVGATVCVALLAAGALAFRLRSVASADSEPPSGTTAIVAIYIRSSTGGLAPCGSGLIVKPGIVISFRDDRRAGSDVFVRTRSSDRLIAARAVASEHPTDLDVYEVDVASARMLTLSETTVVTGDSVYLFATPNRALLTQPATVRVIEDDVFAIVLTQAPLDDQVGSPVMSKDGTVVGLVTNIAVRGHEYLVVPVNRITTRLAGLPEPGPALSALAETPTFSAEGPSRNTPPRADGWIPKDGPGSVRDGRVSANHVPAKGVLCSKARVLNSPRPEYTAQAREKGTEGHIVVRVLFGANGRVKSASIARGLGDGLEEKALEAVYKLEFEPARDCNGDAVDSVQTVSVVFKIP